jgi:predicted deacylase
MAPETLHRRELQGIHPGPHLLITGGVHGDEFEPMAALRRLSRLPLPGLRGRVTLVPVVNTSAFQRGERCGDDGLDLARTCPGRHDGSVTERVAHALAELIRTADFYIDLHTGGTRLRVLPMTGYMLHPDPAILDRQRLMARAFNLPVIWGTDPRFEGRSLSVARDAGVPAIYAEYHGAAVCDPAGIDAYVEGCLNVLAGLDMFDRALPASRVQHVIEDTRPGVGHMQVCHPAPAAGYFEPRVALGQWVKTGDLLGTVTDILGDTELEVRAQQDGIVLVLHTFASVRESDGLVVIAGTGNEGHSAV